MISPTDILSALKNVVVAINNLAQVTKACCSGGGQALLMETGDATKISDLPAAAPLAGNEVTVIVQGGLDVQTTLTDIVNVGGGSVGPGTINTLPLFATTTTLGDSHFIDTSTGADAVSLLDTGVGALGGDGLLLASNSGYFGVALVPTAGVAGSPYLEIDSFDAGTCVGGAACPPILYLTNSRGDTTTPAALQANDWLGQVALYGRNDGGGYNFAAVINAFAEETFAGSNSGSSLHFGTYTTGAGGAGNPPSRLIIDSSGNVNVATGELQIIGDAAWVPATVYWDALSPDNVSFFTATRAMRVKAIIGRLNVAQGTGSTISMFKVPSGTAISGGTVLHSGSFNCNGTANTNQTLTLSGTASDLDLAAGDSLGVTGAGLFTVSVGSITAHMTPI